MASFSFIRGAADGVGKCLATIRVALTASPDGDLAHVELVQEADGDDDQLVLRHVAAGTLQELPTSPTTLISASCKVRSVFLSNTSNAIRQVSMRALTGSLEFLDALELAPGQVLSFDMGHTKCAGGLGWNASGAGVVGAVRAYVAP